GIDVAVSSPAVGGTVRAEWGIRPDEIAVVVPGVLERRKGHAVLLAAAARLAPAGRRLRYVFCGDGREAAALARSAEAVGLAVRFAGFRTDMPACLSAADLVVMPSLMEGLGVA